MFNYNNNEIHSRAGIYSIKNKSTNKTYIGYTGKVFFQRWKEHISLLNNDKHHCHRLQEEWLIYGEAAFTFSIEMIVEKDKLSIASDIENQFIDLYPPELLYNTQRCSRLKKLYSWNEMSLSIKDWSVELNPTSKRND